MAFRFRHFLDIVEIRTKVISLSTYLLGTLYALWRGARLDVPVAVIFLVAMLLVDMGTTAFNSFFDYIRRVDERRYNREREKVLVHSGVAPGLALIVSLALFAAAAVLGVVLALLTDGWVLVAGAVGMMVGFVYNGGPLPLSRTPVGEFFAGGFLGGVLFVVVVHVQLGLVDPGVIVAAIPSTLMIAGVLAANNACDIEGDRAAGRATFAVLVGRPIAVSYVCVLSLGAFVAVAAAGRAGLLPEAAVLAAITGGAVAAPVFVIMLRRGFSHESKGCTMRDMLRVVYVFTAAYAAALIWLLH